MEAAVCSKPCRRYRITKAVCQERPHCGHRPPGTAMAVRLLAWRGDDKQLVSFFPAPKESALSRENGLGIFVHRTDKVRFRSAPCPSTAKEPEKSPSRPKRLRRKRKQMQHRWPQRLPRKSQLGRHKRPPSLRLKSRRQSPQKPPVRQRQQQSKSLRAVSRAAHGRGKTKSGPPRPSQQRQQPSTQVEPCWHFERNRGWCP